MFSTLYFAVAATLATPDLPTAHASLVLDGRFQEACGAVAARTERDAVPSQAHYGELQSCADLQLVLERYEDAEETYRVANKALRHCSDAMRIASCRNAGWQAFFRSHYGTALTCFKRVVDEPEASATQRMESLVGAILVLHHLGRLDAVCARLTDLHELAAVAEEPRWRGLVQAIRRDMLVQYRLRSSERLADHIYWRSVVLEFLPTELGDMNTLAEAASPTGVSLLDLRLHYLDQLHALAEGNAAALIEIDTMLQWSRVAGLSEYHRGLRLEVALAALAANRANLVDTMLEPYRMAGAQGIQHARWYLDYLYCLSKVRQQQGHVQEFSQLYGQYALLSIKQVRADNLALPATVASLAQPAKKQAHADDISARLPGKYRRAYRYLMDNLERADLSVSEVAAHIGVTERALQLAFKSYLGLSPTQLLRRQRMESIRDDLLDNEHSHTSVLSIANKWGVQHRSTLMNGYRKQFKEAPSETLAR